MEVRKKKGGRAFTLFLPSSRLLCMSEKENPQPSASSAPALTVGLPPPPPPPFPQTLTLDTFYHIAGADEERRETMRKAVSRLTVPGWRRKERRTASGSSHQGPPKASPHPFPATTTAPEPPAFNFQEAYAQAWMLYQAQVLSEACSKQPGPSRSTRCRNDTQACTQTTPPL